MGRLLLFVAALAAVVLGAGAPGALAAGWCGGSEQTSADRPDSTAGPQVHVLYAYPSDGGNDFATWAPRIVDDAIAIDAWWRGQDAARTLRWDTAPFPGCSGFSALDLGVLQLSQPGTAFSDSSTGFRSLFREVVRALPDRSRWKKIAVYYDGPLADPTVCGTGGGSPDTALDSLAVVWTRSSCTDSPARRAWVVVHEIVHELGAPPGQEPHPYGSDTGHVGDAGNDLMFPFVGDALANAVLDVNRDDYYRHGGGWFDLATSAWLRHLDQPLQPLTLTVTGSGSVSSDLPGIACTASCTTQWDTGSTVTLAEVAGDGQRFLGWRGGCTGFSCQLTLNAPTSVEAVFGPSDVRFSARVAGKGKVAGSGVSCPSRCGATVTAGDPHTVRATAAKGWRFAGWAGACRGRKLTCTFTPEADAAVQARFTKMPAKPKKR